MDERGRHIRALDKFIDALEAAERARDDDDVWEHTKNALGWLYNFEEWSKARDPGGELAYFTHRANSTNGQTLAGLIWLRGHLQHSGELLKDLRWVPIVAAYTGDGRQIISIQQGNNPPVPFSGSFVARRWPARKDVPASKDEKHGRDALYDQHVDGKEMVPPLRAARDYLVNERP